MPAAFSFREYAVTSVASMSITIQPRRTRPAISSHGNPLARAAISSQTCTRILALACAIFSSVTGSARSRVRRSVCHVTGPPSTSERCSSTATPLIDVSPSAIITAADTSATPRLTSGNRPSRSRASFSTAVSPDLSAISRKMIPPACPTRPSAPAVTASPWSHGISCMAKSAPVLVIAWCGNP